LPIGTTKPSPPTNRIAVKVRSLLPVLALAAQLAGGATFTLPKETPRFSIALPDDWQTKDSDGGLTSRPPGESKFVVNLYSLPDVHTPDAAMSAAVDRVKPTVQQFSAGAVTREMEAGIRFSGLAAKGTKDGAAVRITILVFASDSDHYYGLSLAGEEASFPKYGDAHDRIIGSIRAVRHLKTEVEPGVFAIGLPDENPVFTVKVPSAYAFESDSNQFVAKAKDGLSTVRIAPVAASDAALFKDDDSRMGWVKRKAAELVKADRLEGIEPDSSSNSSTFIADHTAHMIKYTRPNEELLCPFAVYLFTPDDQHYFYACWEWRDKEVQDDWGLTVIESIKLLKH
jgi:hypothetical protein